MVGVAAATVEGVVARKAAGTPSVIVMVITAVVVQEALSSHGASRGAFDHHTGPAASRTVSAHWGSMGRL